MAQLTTTTSSGQQGATQSPQTAGQAGNISTQASSVQPGTDTALLNGQSGVPLEPQPLTLVNINAATSATTQPSSKPATKHHLNLPLLGVSAGLLLVAIVLFWVAKRSVKNTT